MKENTYMSALRLFGADQQTVEQALRKAAEEGCPGLQLLAREDELIICVRAKAESTEKAREICRHWQQIFRKQFAADVYGEDETTLLEASLQAMVKNKKLFVAVNEATGRILAPRLQEQDLAKSAYDFGQHSYCDKERWKKVEQSEGVSGRYPDCPVQPLAAQAHRAIRQCGVDYSVAYQPSLGARPAFVLVCSSRHVWLKLLPDTSVQPHALAVDWMMDMLRRINKKLPMGQGVVEFAYGKRCPVEFAPLSAFWDDEPEEPTPQQAKSLPVEQAAKLLYDSTAQLPTQPEPKKRSHPFAKVLGCVLAVLLIAAIVAAAWQIRASLSQPTFRQVGYGTADFDTAARTSLAQAQQTNKNVAAYLALPSLGGTLIYQPGTNPEQQVGFQVSAADDEPVLAQFTSSVQPGQANANPVVVVPGDALQGIGQLSQQEALQDNSGFTLYSDAGVYRYKVVAVYYWDPTETGETALDLMGLQDLSNYQDFLTFVLGMKARSLYTMPVDLQDGDSFATLVADAADMQGKKLVVTGRMQREDETGVLFSRQIVAADEPLMPLSVYQQKEQSVPDMETLRQYWMNWYLTGGETTSDVQQESGMPSQDAPVAEIPAATDDPSASPEPSEQPEESAQPSEKPEATKAPSSGPSPTPGKGEATPAPTATPKPQQSATQTPSATQSPQGTAKPTAEPTAAPTATPQPTPTPAPVTGPTITVTMNGVRQEMDLVECLAMIARAEMGAGAPVEAYKAQIIAAHSWILSQGGAPSVVGREPNETIRQAAREVANLVVTYNGNVAFTPYFASAAYGTNSSQEVWGGHRPYLVAVDSPHDRNYATNWQNTRVFSVEEVAQRASERLGQDLYAYSEDPAQWMGDLVKNSSGYVTSMRVGNATITGAQLQEKVLNGFSGRPIRSAAFDIAYSDGNFSITTYGYGHGCGMSQFGAWGFAANGWGYQQILAHYYPGTSLSSVG